MNIAAITIAVIFGLFLFLGMRAFDRAVKRWWRDFKEGWKKGY